jgi:hypothetical protein
METKKCPYCGKTVLLISKVCKHCGKTIEKADDFLSEENVVNQPENQQEATKEKPKNFSQTTINPTVSQYDRHSKSFPWTIFVVALVLLLGVGSTVGYYQFYLPYKTDKEAPRFYTFVATNTFLRSSQMSGVEHNVLARIPYGAEIIVYDNGYEWSSVKRDKVKGYISSRLLLPKMDFYLLNSIWGDNESKETINTAKCRIALLNYFKSKEYYGVIDTKLLKSVFGIESIPSDNVWQVFSKQKDSKYNTTYYKRITNKDSKFTDFSVIIKNSNTLQRKCLLFSFSDDETPTLVYEEDAPQEGDIFFITNKVTQPYREQMYLVEYR